MARSGSKTTSASAIQAPTSTLNGFCPLSTCQHRKRSHWMGVLASLEGTRCNAPPRRSPDRKSTRLNSSHSQISYAVFCLKKKKTVTHRRAYSIVQECHWPVHKAPLFVAFMLLQQVPISRRRYPPH